MALAQIRTGFFFHSGMAKVLAIRSQGLALRTSDQLQYRVLPWGEDVGILRGSQAHFQLPIRDSKLFRPLFSTIERPLFEL